MPRNLLLRVISYQFDSSNILEAVFSLDLNRGYRFSINRNHEETIGTIRSIFGRGLKRDESAGINSHDWFVKRWTCGGRGNQIARGSRQFCRIERVTGSRCRSRIDKYRSYARGRAQVRMTYGHCTLLSAIVLQIQTNGRPKWFVYEWSSPASYVFIWNDGVRRYLRRCDVRGSYEAFSKAYLWTPFESGESIDPLERKSRFLEYFRMRGANRMEYRKDVQIVEKLIICIYTNLFTIHCEKN